MQLSTEKPRVLNQPKALKVGNIVEKIPGIPEAILGHPVLISDGDLSDRELKLRALRCEVTRYDHSGRLYFLVKVPPLPGMPPVIQKIFMNSWDRG